MDKDYSQWAAKQQDRGIDLTQVRKLLTAFKIETPSWGYGQSGTRFKVFEQPNAARDVFSKLEDAAQVNKFTGVCPSVAIHIPWDIADNYTELVAFAAELGLTIGAVNPNLFQDDDYKFGSLCNSSAAVRKKAVDHVLDCIDIAEAVGSRVISLWLADGTNYPGQGSFRDRKHWLVEGLQDIYHALGRSKTLLIEYKPFEPAFYHTDIADWGMSYVFADELGSQAQVLVDIGHHVLGTNVEQIVAFLLDQGKLGGLHLNGRKFADDDLISGSTNPYELFLIFREIICAEADGVGSGISYMIDQSHNIEPKIPAMIRSVLNLQTAYTKALLVDSAALQVAQAANDVLGAEDIMRQAFETDVHPLLANLRTGAGLLEDPMAAFLGSGYESNRRRG